MAEQIAINSAAKKQYINYFITFCGLWLQAQIRWVLCEGSHQAVIQVSAGLTSEGYSGKNLLPSSLRCWQNSLPWDYRTGALASCWLLAEGDAPPVCGSPKWPLASPKVAGRTLSSGSASNMEAYLTWHHHRDDDIHRHCQILWVRDSQGRGLGGSTVTTGGGWGSWLFAWTWSSLVTPLTCGNYTVLLSFRALAL